MICSHLRLFDYHPTGVNVWNRARTRIKVRNQGWCFKSGVLASSLLALKMNAFTFFVRAGSSTWRSCRRLMHLKMSNSRCLPLWVLNNLECLASGTFQFECMVWLYSLYWLVPEHVPLKTIVLDLLLSVFLDLSQYEAVIRLCSYMSLLLLRFPFGEVTASEQVLAVFLIRSRLGDFTCRSCWRLDMSGYLALRQQMTKTWFGTAL